MKRFLLNCYFVFYNLSYTKPNLSATQLYWHKALVMLSIPIFVGALSFATLIFDAFNINFKMNLAAMAMALGLTYLFLKKLILDFYKIDKQEDGSALNILVTKSTIAQAILLYVVAFGLMLIRTQLKFGYLVKP